MHQSSPTPSPPPAGSLALLHILNHTLSFLSPSHTYPPTDAIHTTGRAALALLRSNPALARELAYQKLHDVPYRDVGVGWRRVFVEGGLGEVGEIVRGVVGGGVANGADERGGGDMDGSGRVRGGEGEKWIDEVVRILDMVVIMAGAVGREELVEAWFEALEGWLEDRKDNDCDEETEEAEHERPVKRLRVSTPDEAPSAISHFASTRPSPFPTLRFPIPRAENPSLEAFQKKVSNVKGHTPLLIEHAVEHWPALHERPWNDPQYLLSRTLGGRRLVPVEIGRSYTDAGWGQTIITFKEFMETYMFPSFDSPRGLSRAAAKTGYLAQHDLFAQIPSLRADISIPDLCYCIPCPSTPSHLPTSAPTTTNPLSEPLLNAWFGPSGTVSPPHTDPHHNILVQVVGWKYVRLWDPGQAERMYARGMEGGVDMSNTSAVDVDEAMDVWRELGIYREHEDGVMGTRAEEVSEASNRAREDFEERFGKFREATYMEGVLGPGECLYLPRGWWHYVRSLTPSFSVSFWFD